MFALAHHFRCDCTNVIPHRTESLSPLRLPHSRPQEPAYHWIGQQSTPFNVTWQYFDAQDTREPLRIDLAADNQAGTYTFWEFDSGVQDAYLYSLPTNVLAQCNAV